jgi:hypothetical protein
MTSTSLSRAGVINADELYTVIVNISHDLPAGARKLHQEFVVIWGYGYDLMDRLAGQLPAGAERLGDQHQPPRRRRSGDLRGRPHRDAAVMTSR